MPAKLTPKQKKFIDEYLIDLNATQAAIRAGYSEKTARAAAARNMQNVYIQEALQEARQRQQERTEITADLVLKELAKIAFLDVRKFFDDEGNILDITSLDADTAAAIAGMDVVKEIDRDTDVMSYTKKIKLADKLRSLELLGKHLGMFSEKIQVEMPEGGVVMLPPRKDE